MDGLTAAARARAEYALQLLERLVAEPSLEGTEAIERCFALIIDEVEPLARELLRPTYDGLANLVVRFGPADAAPALAFSGHVDVVPASGEWTTPPFEPVRDGDRLRARGVCDMKGGVAAFVAAIRALDDAGLLSEVPLELVLTGDEEVGSRRGAVPLLADRVVEARAAICGEPTGLDLFLGNRGLIWLEVLVRGRGGHAGMAHVLANPVDPALELAADLKALPLEARDERFSPPVPSLTVTGIEATGEAINIVPDGAKLGVDRRLLPGEDVAEIRDQLAAAIERSVQPPFEAEPRFLRQWPPYAIARDEPIAVLAEQVLRELGRPARLGMDLAANDSSWFHAAGIPTILLGPGDPEEAHASDEKLELDQLADAVIAYAAIAARWAVPAEEPER